MIPEEFIDKYRRMRWEFIWDNSGRLRPEVIALGFRPGVPSMSEDDDDERSAADLWGLLDLLFPYRVSPASLSMADFSEGGKLYEESHNWLRDNIRGCWQLWFPMNKTMAENMFLFQEETDAVLFKLRWC